MTIEEMWEEFESQLISEVRTPITMSYNDSIRIAERGIKEVVERWKKRLEQEPCDKCEVGNPCLYCKHEFENKAESEEV